MMVGMSDEPDVCHDASGVLGVRKPSGLPTQAPPGIDSVESWLRARLSARHYLGVPHRLDRAVSGIMVFAVTPRAARQLSRQFARREVVKTYLALGLPIAIDAEEIVALREAGAVGRVWNDVIEKVPDEPRARIVDPAHAGGGRLATTRVRLLAERVGDHAAALLLMQPETGRMHQLRVQAAARGLPIMGDAVYGGAAGDFQHAGDARAAPIALHAWRLAYTDPETRLPVELEAPLPGSWPAAGGLREIAAARAPSSIPRG